ncbi:MAG: ImmA/IrrE family metallo-endopeptidase [Gemmataceae bacterium]|nr:ImmA/IrrE family metallo-endopeptidase [Gemmataceae bacterium]
MMFEDMTREDVHAAVDVLVEELLDAAHVEAPPVDAIALAQRHLGMIVCMDRRQPQRGRAQRAGGRKQIFLRPEPTEERHQWTVAHEIGEHFKASLLERLGAEPGQTRAMAGESLANLFANRLLTPTAWLADDAPACAHDVLELKRRYRTASHEVIAWRLLDLPEPCVITIVDNDRIHRRRSNAWRVRKQLAPAEAECQQAVSADGKPCRVRRDGWTVQGWPVHQADWKREILRSVVESDGSEFGADDVDAEA